MIHLIYAEIITQPTYVGQSRLDKYLFTFFEQGFDLFNIYNLSSTSTGCLNQFDAIFIRKDS